MHKTITKRRRTIGTCESFFFVRIVSQIESAVRFVFESNLRIESAEYHTSRISVSFNYYFTVFHPYKYETAQTTVVYTLHLHPSVFCICDELELCTDYGTPNSVLVYFNSVIKRFTQRCCTLILLPKSTLNANLTTTNRFFTNDD